MHTHAHAHIHSLYLTHTHTHILQISHTHSLNLTYTHTHILQISHKNSVSLSHTHTTHTHTHGHNTHPFILTPTAHILAPALAHSLYDPEEKGKKTFDRKEVSTELCGFVLLHANTYYETCIGFGGAALRMTGGPRRVSHRPGATLTHAAIWCSRGVCRTGNGASL